LNPFWGIIETHTVTENVWYHVSLVIRTGSYSIYVNGKGENDFFFIDYHLMV
jgi:hypothetical protein